MFLFACDCQEFPFGSLGEETSINDTGRNRRTGLQYVLRPLISRIKRIDYAKDKSIQRYEA